MFWGKPRSLKFNSNSKSTKPAGRGSHSVWRRFRWACLIATAGLSTGCMTNNDELKFWGEERDIVHYKDTATGIEYPDVGQESPEKVTASQSPRRVGELKKENIENLTLDVALKTALMNAEVIRDNSQFLSPGNRLLNNPDFVTSVHDIAVQETNTLFGQGGVQAALSEFDATFTANMTWGRSETISESSTIGFNAFQEQDEEFGDFRAQLQKIFGHGGQLTLSHNWFYSGQNQNPGANGRRPFFSVFTSRPGRGQDGGLPTLGAEYREPLWQGRGTEYTRIAGPIARRPTLQSTPTVNQGVVIAGIRTDISIADFEGAVATLLRDVEDVYWELYLSYRTYDTERVSLLSALQTWREVKASSEAGRAGAADEAQSRDNYFEIRARSENALSQLYNTEIRLRRLLGLSANDGNIMRPTTEPITGMVIPDWNLCLTEALAKRPELRRQKWNIKSLELQHKAAEMLVNPRLDFVARYQINGFGDRLTGDDTSQFHSAYASLVQGDQTGWGLGFEFSMPIGFRGAVTQVQNLEHRLTKARSILSEQETEISLELASVMQQLSQNYQTAKTNFNRRRAAERRVQAFMAEYKAGRTTLDMVLRSQISLSQAETAYFASLIGYNRALAELKFRKGSILVDSNVFLSEGLWTPVAYEDAMRRAWERSFAFDAPNMETLPPEFALDCPDCNSSEMATHAEPIPEMEELPPMANPDGSLLVPAPADAEAKEPDNKSALLPYDELDATNVRTDNASTSQNFPEPPVARPIIETVPPLTRPGQQLNESAIDNRNFQPPIPSDGGLTERSFEPPVIKRVKPNVPLLEQPLEFQTPIQDDTPAKLRPDDFYVPKQIPKQPIQQTVPTINESSSSINDIPGPPTGPVGTSRRELLKQSPKPNFVVEEESKNMGIRPVDYQEVATPEVRQAEAFVPADEVKSKKSRLPQWGQFFKRRSK
jgi:outer membrane protein TolC